MLKLNRNRQNTCVNSQEILTQKVITLDFGEDESDVEYQGNSIYKIRPTYSSFLVFSDIHTIDNFTN